MPNGDVFSERCKASHLPRTAAEVLRPPPCKACAEALCTAQALHHGTQSTWIPYSMRRYCRVRRLMPNCRAAWVRLPPWAVTDGTVGRVPVVVVLLLLLLLGCGTVDRMVILSGEAVDCVLSRIDASGPGETP